MAMWSITHSCGHLIEYNLLGNMDERKRKAAWLGTRSCKDCHNAEVAKQPVKVALHHVAGSLGVRAFGETYPHRAALKAAGMKWDGRHWTALAIDRRGAARIIAAAINAGWDVYKPDETTPLPQQMKDQALANAAP